MEITKLISETSEYDKKLKLEMKKRAGAKV